jgi:hypothetical protein
MGIVSVGVGNVVMRCPLPAQARGLAASEAGRAPAERRLRFSDVDEAFSRGQVERAQERAGLGQGLISR